jgi:nucleotide-binding universal stress UspA family protein
MTASLDMPTLPRRILLATDLTSGCDRALDRASQLATEWRAQLHVVHALEASPPSIPIGVDPADYLHRHPSSRNEAMRLIGRSLDDSPPGATIHLEENAAPAAAILAVAQRESCDLIVLGESRQRLLGPILESTIEQVMRQSPISVLVVRDRPRQPYRHLLVGTDFTDEARQALVVAASLFEAASITVMHAFSVPYLSMLDATPDGHAWTATQLEKLHEHVAAAGLPEARSKTIRCSVESGPPGAMLGRYVQEKDADLTVIGAHARGMLFDAVVGNSRRIVDAVPGDLLMVRATRAASSDATQ